jgi:hypothetical protein
MSTVKVDTIKPVTSGAALSLQGDSGGVAVDCLNIDSSGNIDFTGNTDARIKLPSAGGIYESDGSTAILTESGTAVTLNNVSLGSAVTLPSGLITNCESFTNSARVALSATAGGGATATFVSHSYDKKQSGSTLFVMATIVALDDSQGSIGIGFKFGASADVWCGSFTYSFTSGTGLMYMFGIQGELASHTTIGSQTLTLQYGEGLLVHLP